MRYFKVLTTTAIYQHLQLWKQGYGHIKKIEDVDRYTMVLDTERGGFARVDRTARLITGPDFERLIPAWIPDGKERPPNGNHMFFHLTGSYKTVEYRQTKIRRSSVIRTEIIITAYERIRAGSIDFMTKSTYLHGTEGEIAHELAHNPIYARDKERITEILILARRKAYTKNCTGLMYYDNIGYERRAINMSYDNINWRDNAKQGNNQAQAKKKDESGSS